MPLVTGASLGSYQIQAPLGAGGMGEVYRARDLRLNREVALKVLPEAVAFDAERLARFKREAQVLASLNHPGIAAIYGFEESDGTQALVLELVEGPTLAERLSTGPIPIDDAVRIAKQIADALEAAHELGIVHRDLKPANVKVKDDGTVKVLDFGLAKALEPPAGSAVNASLTPTITSPAVTGVNVILGTAAYMSPEQAAGKGADRRADIWSFGAVLYEMLSGAQAFAGESVSDTLASVLKLEPNWTALPATTPRSIVELLRRCLTKDRKRRLQAIGEARIVLESAPKDEPAAKAVTGRVASQLGWAAAAVLLIALATVTFVHFRAQPVTLRTLRYAIALPENGAVHSFAISPDGKSLVIAAVAGGKQQLWLRPLDALQARPLPTTEDAAYPFWSPDSRYIGFFALGKLKKIAASGGPSQSLCDLNFGARGASWSRDDVILFSQTGGGSRMQRISAAGGVPTEVVATKGTDRYPVFLPDGDRFLYTDIQPTQAGGGLYVRSLDGAESRRLLTDSSAAVFAPAFPGARVGHVLFVRENNLMAMPFDAGTAQPAGEAFPLAEGVSTSLANAGYAPITVSDNGVLLYSTGQAGGGTNQIAQYDRSGKFLGIVSEPGGVFMPAISPDEKVIAYSRGTGGNFDIWFRDLARGTDTRFTAGGLNFATAWSPKGDRIVFTTTPGSGGAFGALNVKAVDGSGQADRLVSANNVRSDQWSRDGRFIVFTRVDPKTREDLWVIPLDQSAASDPQPKPFLQTEFSESQGQLSPDSRWMAYTSDESGQRNVYLRAYPSGDAKRRVSTAGGEQPRWRRDGKELFYVAADGKMTAVSMKLTSETAEPNIPTALFEARLIRAGNAGNVVFQYDVTADGQRFVIVESIGSGSSPSPQTLTAVVNWNAELKK